MKRLLVISFIFFLFLDAKTQDIRLSDSKKKVIFKGEQQNYIIGNLIHANFAENRIIIADDEDTKVLALDNNGNLVQKIGRLGRGPGEYINPVSTIFTGNSLLILDSGLNRITSYLLDEETDEFKLNKSGTFDLNMTDLCISEDKLWIYANNGEAIVHQITNDLQSISASISDGFDSQVSAIMEIARKGSIACSNNYIFGGYAYSNTLKIFDIKTQRLVKSIEFDEISPVSITEVEMEGRKAYSRKYYTGDAYNSKGDFHDTLKNLFIINNYLLIQYERLFSDESSNGPTIVSLVLNINNWTYSKTLNLPLIFDYDNGIALSGYNFPLPKLEVTEFDNL